MHGMLKTFTSVKIAAAMIQRKCLYFYISFGTFQIYWNIWQKNECIDYYQLENQELLS